MAHIGQYRPLVPRPRLSDLLLVALALAVVALAVVALRPPAPPSSDAVVAPSPSPAESPAPEVVFLGDDSISTAGRGERLSSAGLAGRQLGWQSVVRALDGTGFVAAGRSGTDTYAERVRRELAGAPFPDLVVVLAGTNDRFATAEELRAAATEAVQALRSTVGLQTRVLLVAPFGSTLPEEQERLAAVAEVLRQVAAVERVHFVDPVADGWLADAPAGAVSTDGLHLTAAGDAYLGERLAKAFELFDVRG